MKMFHWGAIFKNLEVRGHQIMNPKVAYQLFGELGVEDHQHYCLQ